MSWVGFEPTIPMFERKKTVHALHRAAKVIGNIIIYGVYYFLSAIKLLHFSFAKILTKYRLSLLLFS
jgi:hypothetical protein